jgi:uncharacterized zinc-type alcohol dehydrogenase-like protein
MSTDTTASGKTLVAKQVKAFGTQAATARLDALNIPRRQPTAHDVEIEIRYCGVCHSDLHTARNEWHGTVYPCVPGHEIVGTIARVGAHVSKFKVGDLAAVGCMVDSCRECDHCLTGGLRNPHLEVAALAKELGQNNIDIKVYNLS